jgi:hypothetical protein
MHGQQNIKFIYEILKLLGKIKFRSSTVPIFYCMYCEIITVNYSKDDIILKPDREKNLEENWAPNTYCRSTFGSFSMISLLIIKGIQF